MFQKYPDFNFVICHTKHSYTWDGNRGQDWDHWHEEFDIKIGGTIGYEVYWARSGTFKREGDGGYLNVSCLFRTITLRKGLTYNSWLISETWSQTRMVVKRSVSPLRVEWDVVVMTCK